jgi:hypothetical protein
MSLAGAFDFGEGHFYLANDVKMKKAKNTAQYKPLDNSAQF